MIDFETYKMLCNKAKNYDNVDKYIMQDWQDWMNVYSNADVIAKLLRRIYNLAHEGLIEILRHFKMTELSKLFNVPYATVQSWKYGTGKISESTLMLIGYTLIHTSTL